MPDVANRRNCLISQVRDGISHSPSLVNGRAVWWHAKWHARVMRKCCLSPPAPSPEHPFA
eukprot:5724293-Alexandrium_andersonii.AAC.1